MAKAGMRRDPGYRFQQTWPCLPAGAPTKYFLPRDFSRMLLLSCNYMAKTRLVQMADVYLLPMTTPKNISKMEHPVNAIRAI
jgi:hypothetical protein